MKNTLDEKKYYKDYYGSSKSENREDETTVKLCGAMSFAASEAYKLLRANLMFTVPEEGRCAVVGVTSASRGEGKSTTSINLAYTIAEAGKAVLLIDGDLRLPSVARKLDIDRIPGLSNYLIGRNDAKDTVRQSKVHKNLHILPAGDVPPNPSELIGSNRMKDIIEGFRLYFDVIIVDLPPVNIVSDTLAVSKYLDGIIFAVRDNYSSQRDVTEAVERLQFAEANILGFVYTSTSNGKGGYGYKGRYKYRHYFGIGGYKYGKKYGRGYDEGYQRGYEAAYESRPTIDLDGMPIYEDKEF